MTSMTARRVLAVVLVLIAFLALAGSRAFPFLDGISGVAETAIVAAGAACGLTGAWLWSRITPDRH
jgi:hypothetical protein